MKFPFSIQVNKFIFINGKDSSYYLLHILKFNQALWVSTQPTILAISC